MTIDALSAGGAEGLTSTTLVPALSINKRMIAGAVSRSPNSKHDHHKIL
jgi:hypothetical protein